MAVISALRPHLGEEVRLLTMESTDRHELEPAIGMVF